MEIRSAFNSGVDGLQRAQQQAQDAAQSIADQTVPREQQVPVIEPNETQSQNQEQQPKPQSSGLTRELVELKVAEVQAKSSANVIKTADEVVGTMIDTRA